MSASEEFTVVPTVEDDDQTQLLNDEITELRAELQVKEAECIEYDMELTLVKSECEDMKAELSRVKALLAKSEMDRKRSVTKYNSLLDEMRSSPSEMEAKLADYKRKSDDLEDSIENQRSAWQTTGQLLKDQTEESHRQSTDLRIEIAQLNKTLNEERKRVETLSYDLETAQTQSEDWERQYKDMEIKLASAGKTHTDVADMYRQQSEHLQRMATVTEDEASSCSLGQEKSDGFEHVAGEVGNNIVITA